MNISALQTLSDPTRFQIVELLRAGEKSVQEIVDRVDIEQSGVSRHLKILQKAGFARVRPEGQKRFYSLRPEPFMDLDAWVKRYGQLWEGRLDRFGEALALKRDTKSPRAHQRRPSRGEEQ